MSTNPLFPKPDTSLDGKTEDPAVQLIRDKVARAYSAEPDAAVELAKAETARAPSKHQIFMGELSASGKSLAEIQTAWHHYYTTLPDIEKHEVWQEFYDANQHTPYQKLFQKQQAISSRKAAEPAPVRQAEAPQPTNQNAVHVSSHEAPARPTPAADIRAVHKIKSKIINTVNANGKLKVRHHVQSLMFGLATGFFVLLVLLFSFFNEYIIAPFIQPSRTVSATPIILSNGTVAADAPPSVTVPKINIQIPIDFSLTSNNEAVIENGLNSGVVHYPSTVMPGQNGNGAYFGHSSGNIFNNGKYKFAFTLLHDLTTGDIFYINYNGKAYAYRVFEKQIVPPTQVSVINDTRGKTATATLITCDPPGLSTNRLVVWGEQISPDVSTNTAAPAPVSSAPTVLAGNGPTLWSRFVKTLEFWK